MRQATLVVVRPDPAGRDYKHSAELCLVSLRHEWRARE